MGRQEVMKLPSGKRGREQASWWEGLRKQASWWKESKLPSGKGASFLVGRKQASWCSGKTASFPVVRDQASWW